MIKTLNNTIKQDRTVYKIPRSVQDVIPIQRIFADGIFQFGTKYSRTLRFSDINYAIASKEDKTAMFLSYSELLNALDSGSTDELLRLFAEINRAGQTILMVTHSVKAASRAGRVLFIKDGQVFHQLYRGEDSDTRFYQRISDTLTMLQSGGEQE